MTLLLAILTLIHSFPEEIHLSECSKETLDSAYSECRIQAEETYRNDVKTGCDFLMAEWAYSENHIGIFQHFISQALDADTNDETLRADCLSLACHASRLKGNLAEAIAYAEECLEIDRRQDNKENISSSLSNIAALYMTFGKAETARKYIDESIEIEKNLGRNSYLAIRYGMASEIYLSLKESQSALSFAEKALALDSLENRIEKTAIRRSQKGAVLMSLDRNDEAKMELEAALAVFRKTKNHNSTAITLAQLGDIASAEGKTETAAELYGESIEICMKSGNIYVESRNRKGIWELYRSVRPEKALEHLERYVQLQEELHNEKASQMMTSFNIRYETLKKEQTIELQHQKLIWTKIAVMLLVLLLLFVCMVVILRTRTLKAERKKNSVLVKANLDKDRLLAIAKSNIPNEISKEIISITEDTEKMPEIKLTKREMEIALLCTKGKLNKEIAAELEISQRTVETHKNNLFRKLGINNTVELMRYMQWYQNR